MYTYEHEENYEENICRDLKNDSKGISQEEIFGELSVEHLASISGKNQRGPLGNICRIF
jgi:hypothetical protein